MRSRKFIENELITLIGVESEFDTSEDIFLHDFFKNIRKGSIGFTVKELKYGCHYLPLLILGDKENIGDFTLNDYMKKYLGSEIRASNCRNIPLSSNNEILSKFEFGLNHKVDNPTIAEHDFTDKVFIGGNLFKILEFGDYLIIYPNISCMYFNKEELKNARRGTDNFKVIKKTLIKKPSFRNELRSRREELREYLYTLIRNLPVKYSSEHLTVIQYRKLLSVGYGLSFMEDKYAKNINEDNILPFHIDDELNIFKAKTQKEIEEEKIQMMEEKNKALEFNKEGDI